MLWLARCAALVVVLGVAISCSTGPDTEPLSGRWVIEHHRPWNPDGRYRTYLARREASGLRRVSGVLRETRDLGDDCIAFIDGQGAVYGVCGDLPPLFVGLLKGGAGTVNAASVRVEAREVQVPEIKLAAQKVWQERAGGTWIVQREAFSPPDYERLAIERFLLFRDDPERGTYRESGGPTLGYRYLEDDCLISAYAGVRITRNEDGTLTGVINLAATCGRRDEVLLGSIERLQDLREQDVLTVDGVPTLIADLKQRAMAAPMRR